MGRRAWGGGEKAAEDRPADAGAVGVEEVFGGPEGEQDEGSAGEDEELAVGGLEHARIRPSEIRRRKRQ